MGKKFLGNAFPDESPVPKDKIGYYDFDTERDYQLFIDPELSLSPEMRRCLWLRSIFLVLIKNLIEDITLKTLKVVVG